jgi:AcrR family transcriptional regulator
MNDIAEATVNSGLPPRADTAPAEGATGSGTSHSDARSRTDTRPRIQQIAVELFSEHGYEGTSLREIAEHLGVTKAALYYHFKSKEDIILSLVEDYQAQMDALIGWAREHPGNADTRREILNRYMQIVAERSQVFRMLHQNQAALNTMASALRTLKNAPLQLADQLAGPDASLRERARAMMALGSMSVGWMFLSDQVTDPAELTEIVSAIAAELVDPLPAYDS